MTKALEHSDSAAIDPLGGSGTDSAAVAHCSADPDSGPCATDRAAPGALTRARFLAKIDLCVRCLAARLGGFETTADQPPAADGNAEQARVRLWQLLHGDAVRLDDGTPVDFALFDDAIQRVGERLPRRGLPGQEYLMRAAWLLAELTHAPALPSTPLEPRWR